MKDLLPRPDPIEKLPVVVLMVKSNCNCRCTMCDIWLDTSRRELSVSTINGLLPQLTGLGTRELVLSGGEPLMHSEIEKICRLAKSQNINLTLLTTGLLLKRHASWISECVGKIYVSLDGPESVHNEIRNIPNAFGKLASGINEVRSRNQKLCIGGRSTVQRMNFRYMPQTVKAARKLGLDSISFLAADVQAGNFGRSEDWKENGLSLSPQDLPELRKTLDRLYKDHSGDFDNGYIVESREKLEEKLFVYFHAIANQGTFPQVRCNAPWVSTVIETDGRTRPCFFHQPFPGNINLETLPDILNSTKARTWRKDLDVNSNSVCRTCVCSLALAE